MSVPFRLAETSVRSGLLVWLFRMARGAASGPALVMVSVKEKVCPAKICGADTDAARLRLASRLGLALDAGGESSEGLPAPSVAVAGTKGLRAELLSGTVKVTRPVVSVMTVVEPR